ISIGDAIPAHVPVGAAQVTLIAPTSPNVSLGIRIPAGSTGQGPCAELHGAVFCRVVLVWIDAVARCVPRHKEARRSAAPIVVGIGDRSNKSDCGHRDDTRGTDTIDISPDSRHSL